MRHGALPGQGQFSRVHLKAAREINDRLNKEREQVRVRKNVGTCACVCVCLCPMASGIVGYFSMELGGDMVLTGSSNTEGALADAASSVRNVLGSSCHFLSMWFRTAMYCVGARARDGSSVSSSTVMPFQGSQIPRANGGKSTASLLPPPFRILLRLVGTSAASSGTRGRASAGGAGVGSVCADPPSGASPPTGGTIQCALSFLRGDAIARQRARQQDSRLSPRRYASPPHTPKQDNSSHSVRLPHCPKFRISPFRSLYTLWHQKDEMRMDAALMR